MTSNRSITRREARPDPRSPFFENALRAALQGRGLLDDLAATRAERARQQANERLDVVLTRLGLVRETDLVDVLAQLLGLPRARASDFPQRPLPLGEVPTGFLKSHLLLPLRETAEAIQVAVADPFDTAALDALEFLLERPIEIVLATGAEIEKALERLHEIRPRHRDAGLADTAHSEDLHDKDVRRLEDLASDAPVIRLVNDLIQRACDMRASDIHIEAHESSVVVRLRIDGLLHTVETLPATARAAILSRIKIMARLDIAERRLPQDGRIEIAVRGRQIDLRVATMPTMHGESAVLRILDRDSIALDLQSLGFAGEELAAFRKVLHAPNGIVLVTGPTGSGKSTTLYAALSLLNAPARKIFTVEDPVEYALAGVNQIPVNPKIGLTFASTLRAILRQDPDVIMVGEIRDLETAQIAVRASLTGHLVLSTVHTNSAAATLTRLLDMGVEDYLLASSLKGILAQRLVRRLCGCAIPARLSDTAISRLYALAYPKNPTDHLAHPTVRQPQGCVTCNGTGFAGRIAIYEFLCLDGETRDVLFAGGKERAIEEAAISGGMVTLMEHGARRVLAGETTLEEVLRVTRIDDAPLSL